ncbi:MAG: aminotransferase class I/II-fold pyridoxal phosphate-dependent enzyme [Verrucomicrobia bacterium]|nr:aminotransferase class I/II-fold pyridoxal phosphate-dependent enzyme [Verrucomicrobiota bacterium]
MRGSHRLEVVQSPIIPVLADLLRAHPDAISLGQGIVGYAPPPTVAERLARVGSDPALHRYQPVAGLPELTAALADWMARRHGVPVGPAHGNRLLVTAGGNNAFYAALLAATEPGDEVILPTPYYFNHEMAVTMAGCRPVTVSTDAACQLDPAALAAAVTPRTRVIITVSPNNPTGAVYPAATLRVVNALCASRGLYHFSDEAYAEFVHEGPPHHAPASDPGTAAHTVSLHSLSKAFGFAGWRIGWLVCPAALEAPLRKIQDTLLICPPVISQHAALGALTAGPDWIAAQLGPLRENRTHFQATLAGLAADGLCTLPPAAGAFYFLPDLRTPLAPLTVAERLIREHGVAVVPGSAFGCTAGCRLRIAYGALDPARLPEALARLTRGFRALAPP